jgi:methionyl-tRNA synthetase
MNEIKFAEITAVEPILKNPKKEFSEENPVKAYKLTIDAGEETTRTVVSAIAELFTPDELLGKTTTFVMDLPPREIRGFMSQAMIHLNEGVNPSLILGGNKGDVFS